MPDMPVILISATQNLLENYTLCNASYIIAKPFNLNEVIEKIERALPAIPL